MRDFGDWFRQQGRPTPNPDLDPEYVKHLQSREPEEFTSDFRTGTPVNELIEELMPDGVWVRYKAECRNCGVVFEVPGFALEKFELGVNDLCNGGSPGCAL